MVIVQKESLLHFRKEQDLKGERGKMTTGACPLYYLSFFLNFLSFLLYFLSYLFSLLFTLFFFLLPECSVFRSPFQGTARALL